LVIAEQFGTLASFFPGRIDLGIGRAPGGDHRTARALRRHFGKPDTFEQDFEELRGYFRPSGPGNGVHAVPGEGLDVPVWLLGSRVESMDGLWSAAERAQVGRMTAVSAVGSPDAVRRGLEAVIRSTGADELILAANVYEHAARLRSFELIGGLRGPN